MRLNDIQSKTIHSLLDKYEKSKTFLGENKVNQKFSRHMNELFPKYNDDAEYDFFCDVNEALEELQKAELIIIRYQRAGIIKSVELNLPQLKRCYAFVNRESRKEEHDWILEVMGQFQECAVLDTYFAAQRVKISKNQKVEYFDGKKQEFLDLLTLVKLICTNEEEQFIRDFSVRHFSDSKRVENLAGKAQALMYQYGEYQDKESVLEECGIVKTPTYVCLKGNARMTLNGQVIDLSKLSGDVALSTASLKELDKIEILGDCVVTVENLTSFHDYNGAEDFVIYLGGFHNTTKRKFLIYLYEQNRKKKYMHFGDIDAGGFYIYEHLKSKTGIPFRTLRMDVETLKKHSSQTKTLTQTDKKRIESLLKKLDEKHRESITDDDYRNVLQYMLENNCKLEQEALYGEYH